MATIITLSRRQGQEYKYIANLAADEVYFTLLYDMEVSAYEKRYHDIMKSVSQAK